MADLGIKTPLGSLEFDRLDDGLIRISVVAPLPQQSVVLNETSLAMLTGWLLAEYERRNGPMPRMPT